MEIIGKIKKLFELQQFDSGFKKREIVITTEDVYPQDILIEFIQDKIDLLNELQVEDKVKIFINIKGREWKNPNGIIKYFNSVQGWKIEKLSKFSSKNSSKSSSLSTDDFDDLPF